MERREANSTHLLNQINEKYLGGGRDNDPHRQAQHPPTQGGGVARVATGGGNEALGALFFQAFAQRGHAPVFEGAGGLQGVELEVGGWGLWDVRVEGGGWVGGGMDGKRKRRVD